MNDYINSNGIFPSVDRNQRFALVTLNKDPKSTAGFFVSFGQQDFEKSDEPKKIHLKRQDLEIFSPETHTCPLFDSYEDFRIAKQVYGSVGIWINETDPQSGNPWGVEFTGMYHMTNDAHIFVPADQTTIRLNEFATLYEAKMINIYDHRFASSGNPKAGRHIRGSSEGTTPQNYINSEHTVLSRYIVPLSDVLLRKPNPRKKWSIGIRALAGAVANVRTLVVSVLPLCGAGNSLLILDCPDSMSSDHFSCLVCVLNSYLCDYFIRQKISGININQFVLKQLPIVEPEVFNQHCPWQPRKTYTHWILPRIMELSYSAWDIYPFAEDCGYTGPPFRWDESRRFFLKCELDAAIFHIYGINRDDADYILETFPIVKRKDIAQYGEYRTKNLILEIYDSMLHAKETGQPYQTVLDPPPADPKMAHSTKKEG